MQTFLLFRLSTAASHTRWISVITMEWRKKKRWLSGEIKTFLEQYVFQHTSEKLQALSVEVSQLDELDRNGYPCRHCGQRFKYHSTRVK